LVVKNITVTDINTVDEKRIVKVADPTPGVDGPAFFEIVYQDTDGTEKVITVPGVDNGDNTIDVLLPTQVLDKDWFVIRLPLDPDHPAPTQSKLISNSDIVEPVVDFSVVNHATTNQVITYNMKNGSVILDINDISYSKSAVVLEGNSTTTYKIEAPDGTTVSTIGSIALDSGTAMNGDYKFTTVISVTDGGNTTNYSVTKKITIINDTTAPSATLKTTALNGSSISVAKTITVAMEDKESGIASYAIVVKPTNTAPDINSVSLQPVIISDSAYKEVSFTSSLISATNYIYAIVKDNSDNVTIKLLDSYIVPASVAALAAINNATTVLEMSNAIDLNATVLGLDLTAYNLLTDKSAVQDQLIPSTFGNATLLKTIFDQLVADQKVVEFNALKNSTQSELDAVYASYSKLDYYDADWAILQDAYTTASQNITNATNASELTTAKTNGVSAMAAVKTVNQTIEDAITEINNATTESYMSVLITKYADMMDLDLSGYNVVEDKKPVLTELITLTFTSKEQVKAAIIQAVDTQDKKQILADRIAIVKTYVDTTDEKKVASTDKVNIITQLNEVNSILSNGTYLSDKQKEDLNQQKVIFEGYITTINEVQKDLDNAKKIAATVDVEYISTLTKPELEVMATVIANRLADKSNLTQEEIAILTEAGNKLNKAIIVEIKKQESPINIPKDSSVLILEKQIEDLPNAVTSSDKIIKDNESAIMSAKETYDLLGTKKTQVSAELVLKLDQLIDRLSNINVKLDSTKAGTNVSATGLGLLVTRADVESGKDINITLNVVSKTALQPEKDTIVILTENKVIGAYFDINIYKQVGTSDPVRIGELDNQVCISIEIPDNIKGKLGYSIVRVHNGVPEILVSTQVGDILSFYTDKFSTYAIIYNEEIVIAPATAPLGAPQTGDNHGPIVLWVLTSAFVFGGLEITRRRNIKVPFSDEK